MPGRTLAPWAGLCVGAIAAALLPAPLAMGAVGPADAALVAAVAPGDRLEVVAMFHRWRDLVPAHAWPEVRRALEPWVDAGTPAPIAS